MADETRKFRPRRANVEGTEARQRHQIDKDKRKRAEDLAGTALLEESGAKEGDMVFAERKRDGVSLGSIRGILGIILTADGRNIHRITVGGEEIRPRNLLAIRKLDK